MPSTTPIITEPYGLRRFTLEEYHRLGEVGVLSEGDRVELLDGLILEKMIHSPLHDATVSMVESNLREYVADGELLRIQSSIETESSQPEPDVAIVAGPPRRYLQHHPRGDEIRLVIEVADSSLERDRQKAAIYAAAGIPEYWIINLRSSVVEQHREPIGGTYHDQQTLGPADTILFRHHKIPTSRFLPV
jgi:Uma2 family endonuclease